MKRKNLGITSDEMIDGWVARWNVHATSLH